MHRAVMAVIAAIVLTSCSLFGPASGRIERWLEMPEPGATYTYTITTTWHDGSRSTENRSYVVERVEELNDGGVVMKLADEEHLSALYWLIEPGEGGIYESRDDMVDGSDLLVLLAPVEEGAAWTFGAGDTEIDYEIDDIAWREAVEYGSVRDLVTVSADPVAVAGVAVTIQWSPDVGLVSYEERYASGASYILQYRRDLTAIERP